ncbi:PIN domain-containing protein [Rhodohalobacter sulfatireducens]|uniref:PIN domain-containing protein n=1 Tax=Rhodohalobacter sulfatireducens TaxID=2911366 RepID=A0ABS9KFG3_9BACT|nr:PIN domain-containing protein [Rhodohalobacter sulfatireducens]MCG2589522.1 PIN domain-containing protein [Rhodohalobacter sulfatireducens]
MDVLFIDTNAIRNDGVNSFFGNIEELERIQSHVQIAIPKIVIEEIKVQKRSQLVADLSRFKGNYFTGALEIDTSEYLEEMLEQKINQLYEECLDELEHIELDFDLTQYFDDMTERAIHNNAPFNKKNDKGYKDSLIFYTVIEYIQQNPNDEIFVLTNDSRLEEAFSKQEGVNVIGEVDEYYEYRKGYFSDEYFIGRLREDLGVDEGLSIEILDANINEDDDWIVSVEIDGAEHTLVVDFYSKEIIEHDY